MARISRLSVFEQKKSNNHCCAILTKMFLREHLNEIKWIEFILNVLDNSLNLKLPFIDLSILYRTSICSCGCEEN